MSDTRIRGRKPETIGQLADLNPLDPANFKTDPYEPRYQVYPLADDLRKMGVYAKQVGPTQVGERGGETAAVHTRVPVAVLYAIDRIIERRVTGFKSRAEVFRTGLVNLVFELADEIQQDQLGLTLWRMNQTRRTAAELVRLHDYEEMVELTRAIARKLIDLTDLDGARQALRDAKRFMEDIPIPHLRERFEVAIYGGVDGIMPEHWEDDEVALMWSRVLNGELDVNDEVVAREQVRLN